VIQVFLAPAPWNDPGLFGEQVMSGLATGSIYALLALAIVLIYRSTDVVNFAQGEMAMFVTFPMWSLTLAGFPPWTVIFIGIALGFALGGFIERTIIRPVEDKPQLNVVVVTLGLFVFLNSIATWIWAQGELPKVFATPFEFNSVDVGLARVTTHSIGIFVVALIIMAVLYLLFSHTKLGLGMRATAHNPDASRLMITFLFPGFMLAVLLYAFAAAVFGGLDSPPGAIVGGLFVGVAENLFGTYTPSDIFGPEMKLPLTLLLLVIVLLFRPQGLFGHVQTRRV